MSPKPWDIYAKELFSVGLGYPLWMPELSPSSGREVFIGEVGWLKEGEFCAFFNAMKGADHPINQGKSVPGNFQIFCPPNLSIGKSDKVTQEMVFSQSISGNEAQADLAAVDSVGAISTGVGRRFRTRSDAGAFVMLDPPGVAEQIESKRHIVNYMRDHFDSWLEFANGSHLDLRADDIMFVCGTLKTARWAVAAFQGDIFRDKDGSVFGQLDPYGHSNISIHISDQSLPDDRYRTGPRPLPGCRPDIPLPSVNQCLFVHYYKMKHRLQALPGPHQLSLEPKTRECDNASYDPVSHILDYILQNSEAEIAIASDLDLVSLFRDRTFPDNIADVLMQLRPTVDLDENGVGTIDCDCISKSHMGTQPTPQDFSPAPHYAAHPPESPVHRGPAHGDPAHGDDEGGSVTALAYSADGKYLASGSPGAAILIWDANTNTVRHEVPLQGDAGHGDALTALAFSRNNTRLASASRDGEIIVWGVENGRERMRLDAWHAIHSLAYTPDGMHLIGGAGDGTLHLWDAQTHEEVWMLTKSATAIAFVIFSDDGRLMATGGAERKCYIWETESLRGGEPLSVLERHRGNVTAAAFSPDSRRIAVASDDGGIGIWNAGRGEMLVIIYEHTGPVWTVAFSPDGKCVASGASDSTVKVCDSFTGKRRLSLEGHNQGSMINAVRFSPGGRYIASAASDNTVRLWNASDGTLRTTYSEHKDNVTALMFAPDGSTLASSSRDGTVFIRPWMKEN